MNVFKAVQIVLLCGLLLACTGYKSQYVAFKPPDAYANRQVADGITVAGEAYSDAKAAKNAFGFDIRDAGLLPVQLVMENHTGQTLNITGGQTFLVDNEGGYWPIVPNATAVERIEKSTQLASFFGGGAGKGALIGTAGGAILGAALGIVSGSNVAESLGKGAALGAAGGAVIGGAREGTSSDRRTQIGSDLRSKGLEGKEIPPEYLANGFIYFPGEAASARELRLQLQERGTGEIHTFILPLQ